MTGASSPRPPGRLQALNTHTLWPQDRLKRPSWLVIGRCAADSPLPRRPEQMRVQSLSGGCQREPRSYDVCDLHINVVQRVSQCASLRPPPRVV